MNVHTDDITDLPVTERGGWLATATGQMWSIEHPHPRDVNIRDIAAGLSRQCRYAGQIRVTLDFYSVCEHSVLMTVWAMKAGIILSREDALAFMMHDASEAFFGDMPTPLKALLPEYKRLENQAQDVISEAFGITGNTIIEKSQIKEVDVRIRLDERLVLSEEPACQIAMKQDVALAGGAERLGMKIGCWSPKQSRMLYLGFIEQIIDRLPCRNPDNEALHAETDWGRIRDEVQMYLGGLEGSERAQFFNVTHDFDHAIECCPEMQVSAELEM